MRREDLATELLTSSARLSRWASRHADLGLPAAQVRTLSLLDDLGPSRITVLAQHDEVSQPSMTGQVSRLESLGLVRRDADPTDARASIVKLTDKGVAAIARARRDRARVLSEALEHAAIDDLALAEAATTLTRLLAATKNPQIPSRQES